MIDMFLSIFDIDILNIITFVDLIIVSIKIFIGIIILRLFFNFFAQIFPSNSKGIFKGL